MGSTSNTRKVIRFSKGCSEFAYCSCCCKCSGHDKCASNVSTSASVSATAFMSLIALGWGAKSRGSSANAQVPSLPVAGTANTNISGAAAVENVK